MNRYCINISVTTDVEIEVEAANPNDAINLVRSIAATTFCLTDVPEEKYLVNEYSISNISTRQIKQL